MMRSVWHLHWHRGNKVIVAKYKYKYPYEGIPIPNVYHDNTANTVIISVYA